jgi:small subunit ribosomal protein S19e
MVDPKIIPADRFIAELARYLKENVKEIQPPQWSVFVKTSPSRERLPIQNDWWYIRAAAILRKVYLLQPVSVKTLRVLYGGRKKFSKRREHHVKASGAIIRKILQQLEMAGYVKKTPKGRILTSEGQSLLYKIADKLYNEIVKEIHALAKYR